MAGKAASQTAEACPTPRRAVAVVVFSCLLQTLSLSSLLSKLAYCPFLSTSFWTWQVELLGGEVQVDQQTGQAYATVPLGMLFATSLLKSLVMLFAIGTVAAKLARRPVKEVILRWAWLGWLWLCVFGCYELVRVVLQIAGFFDAADVLGMFAYYFSAIGVAGCLAMIVPAVRATTGTEAESKPADLAVPATDSWSISRATLAAAAIFSIVFTAMNWQIYNGLLLPHGDSAMYGEHLWNITHGKGFRSYLDQGLFLGEHVQVVHLLLLPLYVAWPSQLLLELCETLVLAAGAIPVFWIARRHSGSTACASLLAITWLLYTPLQYLDIEIDLKTFRPMSFGVTAMLFGIDFFERGRLKSTAACFLLALAAKEDFALILIPLGVWLAGQSWWQRKNESANLDVAPVAPKRGLALGAGLTVFSLTYLLLVTRVVIPWFRDGKEVHYARYFAKFGDSLGEIVVSMLTDPALVFDEFVTITSANYLLALFVPLAFLPFLSPSRLLVAAPILGLLCLNEIVKSDPFPRHHFQGPVLPILFWSAAAGLGIVNRLPAGRRRAILNRVLPGGAVTVATFGCLAAMQSGAMLGMSPASLSFWDSGSPNHWSRYVPGERAEMIELVLAEIPENSRVASTDYVHTRLTHYERSYDYSDYRREVAGDKEGVPADTDFIVIDMKHHYNTEIRSPADVRELQTEPGNWVFLDELYEKTNGCFIVLKRRD